MVPFQMRRTGSEKKDFAKIREKQEVKTWQKGKEKRLPGNLAQATGRYQRLTTTTVRGGREISHSISCRRRVRRKEGGQ